MEKYRKMPENNNKIIDYMMQTRSNITYDEDMDANEILTRTTVNTSLRTQADVILFEFDRQINEKLEILRNYAKDNPDEYRFDSSDETEIAITSLSSDVYIDMVWYPHTHTAGSGPCTGHVCAHTGLDSHTDTCLL